MELARAPVPLTPSRWRLPDPDDVDVVEGLVGVGADLEAPTLVDAYRRGIFPWPHGRSPLPWFSPDPRAVVPVGGLHVSRSLRRTLRRSGWTTTVDADFAGVMRGCAEDRDDGTWITRRMQRAYAHLHDLGWAHSVEVWDGDRLVGGLYGVQVGGVLTGESMFHRASDASKVALLDVLDRLDAAGGTLLDAQLPTDHLLSLGFTTVPRGEFLATLATERDRDVRLAVDRRPVAELA